MINQLSRCPKIVSKTINLPIPQVLYSSLSRSITFLSVSSLDAWARPCLPFILFCSLICWSSSSKRCKYLENIYENVSLLWVRSLGWMCENYERWSIQENSEFYCSLQHIFILIVHAKQQKQSSLFSFLK